MGQLNEFSARNKDMAEAEEEKKGLELKDGVLTYKGKFEYDWDMNRLINKNKPFIQKVDFSQAIELSVLPNLIFWECINLQEVLLPEGLNIIGKSAFKKCESLKNIVIPSTVASIESEAFQSSGIESISLPENLKKIGDWVFSGCESLKNIVIPSTVESIEEYAFSESGIESISLPGNLKKIGDRVFGGCKSLRKVDIPSAESIGDGVFNNCSIEPIILPANLKTCESYAAPHVDASPCREMQNILINPLAGMVIKVLYLPSELEEATLSGGRGMKIYAPKSLKRIKLDRFHDFDIMCFAPRMEMHIERCGNIYVKEEFVERYKALAQRECPEVEIEAMDKIYEYFYDE